MSREWSLKIPFRSDESTLDEVAADCRFIADPEERAVALEMIAVGEQVGMTSAKHLRWLLEDLGPQRRFTLDKLRQRIGLKSASEIDAREHMRQRCLQAAYPKNYTWNTMTGETHTIGEAEADAAQARSRETLQRVKLEQRAGDAERHRLPTIHADNLPQ